MKVTYIADYNPLNIEEHSGTVFWISKSLQKEMHLDKVYINEAQKLLPFWEELKFRCKNAWLRMHNFTPFDPDFMVRRAMHLADVAKPYLKNLKSDAILTALSPTTAAYLETKIPIVYWADFVYSSLAAFYPFYRNFNPSTAIDIRDITSACLMNAKLIIFSTEWAARTAVEFYGISRHKIKVVPFGANLEISHNLADVKIFIDARSKECIKLLFVGKTWFPKGGDIVLKIAKYLHETGYPVEVNIVGCKPYEDCLPSYVKYEEFITKKINKNIEKLKSYYREAHFLFVPSRAETFGIVFCEANAFGVPAISTYIGGIADVIKDGINGMTFSMEATIKEYCDFIVNTWENKQRYKELALSSFNEYETRLNWQVAARKVKSLIAEVI